MKTRKITFGYFYKTSKESIIEALKVYKDPWDRDKPSSIPFNLNLYESIKEAKEAIKNDKKNGDLANAAKPKIMKLVVEEVSSND